MTRHLIVSISSAKFSLVESIDRESKTPRKDIVTLTHTSTIVKGRSTDLVSYFTWTKKTKEVAVSKARAHKIINAAIMATFLIAMGTLGVLGDPILGGALGIASSTGTVVGAVGNGVSFVGNSFIGLSSLADKLDPMDPYVIAYCSGTMGLP
jgi:hypothetical protein